MQPPLTVAFTCQRGHIWPQAWLEGLGGNDMMMHGIDVGAVAPHCGRPLDGGHSGTRRDVHHHYGTGHCSPRKASRAAVIEAALAGRVQITGYSSISSHFFSQAQQHFLSHRASDVVFLFQGGPPLLPLSISTSSLPASSW